MIGAARRSEPRFPQDNEPVAAADIGALLDELGAGGDDVAFSSGACAGDLLFAEACWQHGLRVEIYLPFVRRQHSKPS